MRNLGLSRFFLKGNMVYQDRRGREGGGGAKLRTWVKKSRILYMDNEIKQEKVLEIKKKKKLNRILRGR